MELPLKLPPGARLLDNQTIQLKLIVSPSKIVLLQAYFDITENLGTVRTLEKQEDLVGILCSVDMLADCLELLDSIRDKIPWHFAINA